MNELLLLKREAVTGCYFRICLVEFPVAGIIEVILSSMLLLCLQLVEFVHRIGLDVIGNVYVWFHRLVVAVSRPLHHHLCGNTQCQALQMNVRLPAWVPSRAYLGVTVSIRSFPL